LHQSGAACKRCKRVVSFGGSNEFGFSEIVFGLGVLELDVRWTVEDTNGDRKHGIVFSTVPNGVVNDVVFFRDFLFLCLFHFFKTAVRVSHVYLT